MMRTLWENHRKYIKSSIESLEKWRWMVLATIGLSLLWVEIQEFLVLRVLNQAFHYFEVFQYAVLLGSTGVLIELFARSNLAYKQAVRIFEYKHKLSLELTSNDDWEALIHKITEIPSTVTTVDETYLLVKDPVTGKFKKVGHWITKEHPNIINSWNPLVPCKKCLDNQLNGRITFHLCSDSDNETTSPEIYNLGLHNQTIPGTMLKFKLKPGSRLSRDEEQIFKNIGDEIVAVLQTSQDRKRLSEMQSAEVAMAERRIVSSYVHDQLGQNLGYLHLKLDQLSANEGVISTKEIRKELKHLQEVANESYEIVRDILKKIQPETIPHLTNLLREHAKTVSRRANFSLNFKSIGTPIHLATNTQQLIFFTFREIFSNVEKHAGANHVEVLVIWNDGLLDISVTDNGKGFDPGLVQKDEHFGLEIMQERIATIKGKLVINSLTDSGTVVSLSIPVESTIKASI